MEETKPKVWSLDQHSKYDVAMDMISELKAIFRRQSRVIDSEELISAYKKRASELHKEKRFIDGFNEALIEDVCRTYSALVREYYDMGSSAKEIAAKGLPEKFLTAKVDYAKYGK